MERDTASITGENGPVTTRVVTKRIVPVEELESSLLSPGTHEEWTTSKKKVNHKTKQVETRVQRQIILEDGKVIADSGPQVTTRTTEDNKTEESENTEHKTSGDPPNENLMITPSAAKIVSEKTEIHQTTKETKEENMKLHDESYRELTGTEYHQQALMSQEDNKLSIAGDGKPHFPGKLTHYSSRSQKVTDKDEIKETSELKDGELTTETTRTHHHEEKHDDEVPEDEVDEAGLPEISSETTRKIEYYNADDLDSLSEKIRKEREKNIKRETSPDRKDPLTRRKLNFYQEEGIRNNETSRWLEDHFGSDGSDIVETPKTRSGGNVINIQMTPPRKPTTACEHEHADDTTLRPTAVGMPRSSERLIEKPTYNYSSNVSSLNSMHVTKGSSYKTDEDMQKHSHVHTDVYQTPPRKAARSPTYTKNTSIKTNHIIDKKKNVPKKTFYLGENGTYNTTFSKPLRESSPLQKNSPFWKSSPSIADDFARMYGDEHRVGRHESLRNDVTFGSKNVVQRSQSQRGLARNIPIRKDFSTYSNENTSPHGGYVSQTLPRDTKFFSKNKNLNRCLFPSSCENLSNTNFDNNNSRIIHVELTDEKFRGSSPSFFHRPEAREPQTLPRAHSSSSPFVDSSDNRNRSTSPYKSQNNFYFGDSSETRSYQNSLRKSTSESSNHYQDGIKTSDSFTFTPNPRSTKFRPSPRAELLNYRNSSNFEDGNHHFSAEKDRSFGDTLVKNNYCYDVDSHAYENYEPKNAGLVRIAEHNSKNNQPGRKYLAEEVHQKSSYSDVNETRRNQFMRGLISSSDQTSDKYNSYRRSYTDDHQRQSSLSVNYEPIRSPSPRSRPDMRSDRPSMYSTQVEPSSSFHPSQHKGLLKTASFSRQRDSKNRMQTSTANDMVNPPAFSPLSCHLEIKNMSSKNASKYAEQGHISSYQNKSLSKTGPIMVEIRDWDSR